MSAGLARLRLLSAAGPLLLAACSPAQLLNATIPRDGLTITRDLAYGPGDRDRLDVYRPTGATALPIVVFIYGGAWTSGSKSLYPFVAATLARRGNVVVVPDYRLYPAVRYPGFLRDCARAVAWTAAHAGGFGGDARRLFVMGHSAGAYNALMLALDPALLREAGYDRDALAGAIGLAGPYDFLPMTGTTRAVFGDAVDSPATQPVTYADGHAPKLLLLAGGDDRTVRARNTVVLAGRVQAAGGAVQSRIYPGVGHIGLVLAFAPLFRGKAPVLDDVEAFVRNHSD